LNVTSLRNETIHDPSCNRTNTLELLHSSIGLNAYIKPWHCWCYKKSLQILPGFAARRFNNVYSTDLISKPLKRNSPLYPLQATLSRQHQIPVCRISLFFTHCVHILLIFIWIMTVLSIHMEGRL